MMMMITICLLCRLQNVIQTIQWKNPATVNPEVIKEIRSLNERMHRVDSVLESTKERIGECKDLQPKENIVKRGNYESRDPFEALGEKQRSLLESRLANK